jgi:sulfate permease, SulP family
LDHLVPKLVTTLRGYTRDQFFADLIAGLIVAIVALPLAIAFAIASGGPPERGLFTAIVAGFIIAALGGSRVQIGGPTGAFVLIVYTIGQRHGMDGLAAATMMAGVILVVFGLVRLGGAIRFIPYPIPIGFTSGIALLILSGEVKDFSGLRMGAVPANFLERWQAFATHLGSINPWAVLVAVAALVIILGWPYINRRVPSPFVALVATTALVSCCICRWRRSPLGSVSSTRPYPRPDSRWWRWRRSLGLWARRSRSPCSARSNRCSPPWSRTA